MSAVTMEYGAGMPFPELEHPNCERLRRMWPPGSKCKIHSLRSEAGQHMNGQVAEVQDVDVKTSRLVLRLHATDSAETWKKVKPENVSWEGLAFRWEADSLQQNIIDLVCRTFSSPLVIDQQLVVQLKQQLDLAYDTLPNEDFLSLQSFAEQSRSHASQWLMYHELRLRTDIEFDQHGSLCGSAEGEQQDDPVKCAKKAYWDVVRANIIGPDANLSFLVDRVAELLDMLSAFVPEPRRPSFKTLIDMEMLKSQVDNHAFDYVSLQDLVHRLSEGLMELESQHQSERTQQWLSDFESAPIPDDENFRLGIIECLSFFFEKAELLRMEVHNYGLQQVRETKLQALEVETFNRMRSLSMLRLDRTRSWLTTVAHNGNTEIAVIKGVASLLIQREAISVEQCPETLRCDLQRLHEFQNALQGVALLGLVALVATPLFPPGIGPGDAEPMFKAVTIEIQKTHPKLELIVEAVAEGIIGLRDLQKADPIDPQKLESALKALRTCLGEDVPAFRLIHDRARTAFQQAVGPPKQHVISTGLGESPWSLRYAVAHLNASLDHVWTFIADHCSIYGQAYSEIIAIGETSTASQ